jgi:hypothetical protein
MQRKALNMVEKHEKDLKRSILRMNIIKAGLAIQGKGGALGEAGHGFDETYDDSFVDMETDETMG